MNLILTITELSNLTGKTRPTLYKYVNSYDVGDYDNIPYSFIQLFKLMSKPNAKKSEIISFCRANFVQQDKDEEINEFINFLKQNKDKINLKQAREIIEEAIKNGKSN